MILLNDYQEFYFEIKLDESPEHALYLKKKLIMKVYKVFICFRFTELELTTTQHDFLKN